MAEGFSALVSFDKPDNCPRTTKHFYILIR